MIIGFGSSVVILCRSWPTEQKTKITQYVRTFLFWSGKEAKRWVLSPQRKKLRKPISYSVQWRHTCMHVEHKMGGIKIEISCFG
jgi:hypothetical protein